MAASVRIEDDAFSDERFEDLALHAGLADADHARGKMARLWRQCTIEKSYVLPVTVIDRVLGAGGAGALVRARLGQPAGDDLVRIKGTEGRVEWKDRLAENSSKGGKARAKSATRVAGRFTSRAAGALDQPPPGDVTSAPSPSPSEISDLSHSPARAEPAVSPDRRLRALTSAWRLWHYTCSDLRSGGINTRDPGAMPTGDAAKAIGQRIDDAVSVAMLASSTDPYGDADREIAGVLVAGAAEARELGHGDYLGPRMWTGLNYAEWRGATPEQVVDRARRKKAAASQRRPMVPYDPEARRPKPRKVG